MAAETIMKTANFIPDPENIANYKGDVFAIDVEEGNPDRAHYQLKKGFIFWDFCLEYIDKDKMENSDLSIINHVLVEGVDHPELDEWRRQWQVMNDMEDIDENAPEEARGDLIVRILGAVGEQVFESLMNVEWFSRSDR